MLVTLTGPREAKRPSNRTSEKRETHLSAAAFVAAVVAATAAAEADTFWVLRSKVPAFVKLLTSAYPYQPRHMAKHDYVIASPERHLVYLTFDLF